MNKIKLGLIGGTGLIGLALTKVCGATTTLTFQEAFAVFDPLLTTAKESFLGMLAVIVPIGLGLAILGWGIARVYGLIRGR